VASCYYLKSVIKLDCCFWGQYIKEYKHYVPDYIVLHRRLLAINCQTT